MKKIGLLLIATNKYAQFIEPLLNSADNFFFKNKPFNYEINYFIFTDKDLKISTRRSNIVISVEHKPWPWMTLGRYKIFDSNKHWLEKMDYLFYTDVDMRFAASVDEEILSDRVATVHPGFDGGRGTPEGRRQSLAYVSPDEHLTYFAGGFNGGSSIEYLKMCKKLSENIEKDYSKNIIAVWHDESHMNRYFIDNPPTKILNPSYCYPESWSLPYDKKLLALDKNHGEIRK